MTRVFDVAIVGYGPVGATAAALLAGRGLRVVVIEASSEIYDKPRAITGDHEVSRIMQFAGIAEKLWPLTRDHRGTQYLGVDGEPIMEIDIIPPPYPLGWAPAFHFIQPELEELLREKVASTDATVLLSNKLTKFVVDGERIFLTVEDSNALTATIETKYLLACDGANSFVRRTIGIRYEDLDFDEWWIVVDAWLRRETAMPPKSTQYCRPSRPGTAVIGPRDLRRWEIKMLPHESPDDFRDQTKVVDVLRSFVDTEALEIWRSAVYRFHALVAAEWRHGNIFLLGDSAHQMPPFLGQGMCAGVRDAANLAWKLLLVELAGVDPALLDTYQDERKPHVRQVVALAKERGLIIGELDVERALARDERLRAQAASGLIERKRHRYIPGLVDGLIGRTGCGAALPHAGEIFVQPEIVYEGSPRRLDDVYSASFLIVASEVSIIDSVSEELKACINRLGAHVVVIGEGGISEVDAVFSDWMREREAKAAVIRPDRYVFGTAGNHTELTELLRQVSAALSLDGKKAVNRASDTADRVLP